VGGRALLAFRGTYEKDALGEPTADALLGAIMESEFQSATVQQVELLSIWAKNWHKAHSK